MEGFAVLPTIRRARCPPAFIPDEFHSQSRQTSTSSVTRAKFLDTPARWRLTCSNRLENVFEEDFRLKSQFLQLAGISIVWPGQSAEVIIGSICQTGHCVTMQ